MKYGTRPELLEDMWTGKNALVSYVAANTASYYRFAQKAVKRLERRIREDESKER